jgi:hypothetical protein
MEVLNKDIEKISIINQFMKELLSDESLISKREIYDKYKDDNTILPKSYPKIPDKTNLLNFEKDVKCEDLCDIGFQGDKNGSWLCRTSRPLSDFRCCKVDEGQWCPSANSIINSDIGTITLEPSGSGRCCCGEVLVEEDIIRSSTSKEERISSLDSEFLSMFEEDKIYSKTKSTEIVYLDKDGNPIANKNPSTNLKDNNNELQPIKEQPNKDLPNKDLPNKDLPNKEQSNEVSKANVPTSDEIVITPKKIKPSLHQFQLLKNQVVDLVLY